MAATTAWSDRLQKGLLVALVLAGYFAVGRLFLRREAGSSGPAPDFTRPVAAGAAQAGDVHLAELRGHPVIVDFWATWCGPCQLEMPIVDRIARRYEEQGLRVVGVNTSDELDTLADWSKRNQPRYPIVFDEGNRIARSFGVRSLPTLVVVGKDGNIVAIRTGLTDEGDLDKLVRSAL